jgi:hypothetical protein
VKHHHISIVSFLTPLAIGGVLWQEALEPGHLAGLGLFLLVCVTLWPFVALMLWSAPSLLMGMVTTNRERAAYRHRRKDAGKGRSAPIRSWVHRAVIKADRKRCVSCHQKLGQVRLQADHFRPYALGGLSSIFNLFALCESENLIKSDYWVDPDGYVHYHPWGHTGDIEWAARILAAEQRYRRNKIRWFLRLLRAAWALAW